MSAAEHGNMRQRLSTFGFIVGLGCFVFAQVGGPADGAAQQANIEQTLRRLSDQWAKAPLTGDAGVLRRIWAADFIYVEPSGKVFNKEEGIANIGRTTEKYT